MHIIRTEHSTSSALDEDTQLEKDSRSTASQLIHLVRDCHAHQGQPFEIVRFLCREIDRITHGNAELILSGQTGTMQGTVMEVPVACRHRTFGALFWNVQAPMNDLHEIVQVCGDILCHIALAALVYGSLSQDILEQSDPLTPREREVLECLRQHQSQQDIAKTLHVALRTVQKHRENIYDKLCVNHEVSVSIAAYHAGLYSPLEKQTDEPHASRQAEEAGAQFIALLPPLPVR